MVQERSFRGLRDGGIIDDLGGLGRVGGVGDSDDSDDVGGSVGTDTCDCKECAVEVGIKWRRRRFRTVSRVGVMEMTDCGVMVASVSREAASVAKIVEVCSAGKTSFDFVLSLVLSFVDAQDVFANSALIISRYSDTSSSPTNCLTKSLSGFPGAWVGPGPGSGGSNMSISIEKACFALSSCAIYSKGSIPSNS